MVEVFVESIAVFCIMLVAYAGMFRMLVRDSGEPTAERQTLGIIGAISLVLGVWFGQFQAYIMWYCTAMTLAILTVLVGTYLFEKLNATEQQNQQTVQNEESVI